MKRSVVRLIGCAALLAAMPTVMSAHFRLLEPASWLMEDARGDPQKAGPCGGTNADWGKPSYVVTKVIGGQKLHIKVQETIYHPGHYRVALAVNSPTELPRDPEAVTVDSADKGRESVSAKIQDPPQMPVLADGLWVHTAKVDGAVRDGRAVAEHQLQEVHAPGRAVHGGARLEQSGELHLSPLRGPADHGGPGQADRQTVAGRAAKFVGLPAVIPVALVAGRAGHRSGAVAPPGMKEDLRYFVAARWCRISGIAGGLPVPPRQLTWLVAGHYDVVKSLRNGRRTSENIREALGRAGLRLEERFWTSDAGPDACCATGSR